MADRTVSVRLLAEVGPYVAGMSKASAATMSFGDSANANSAKAKSSFDVASKGALIMGAAVVAGVGMAISKSMEFEKSMSAVQAATGASVGALGDLRDAAMRAGADTQYSATEAADGITEMAKAGVSAKDIMGGGLKGALSLAAAGQLDVADAAGIASVAMTQFSLSGKDLPHVADLLAAGAGKAMGSVDDLGMALNQSGLVASAAGLSIEETTGTLAAFASAGLLGSDAGTSLKTMLQKLQAPSGEAAGLMSELGISMYDANGNMLGVSEMAGQLQKGLGGLTEEQRNSALATIFGSDAVRAANVLYKEGAAGISEWTNKVDDQGFAAEQAAALTDNLAGDLERLGGSFDTLLITLGEGAQGPLRALTQGLGGIVDGITWMVNAWDSIPVPVQAGIGALAAVKLLSGPLQTGFQMVSFAVDVMTASFRNAGGPMSLMKSGAGGLLGILGGPWGLAITGATVALTGLWAWLNRSSGATDEAKSAAQRYAHELERANGAIDENVRVSASKAAEDAGILDVAKRAGISLNSVTDAILGQSGALKDVRGQLREYITANTEMTMTENGPVYHLNAEGKAAQETLAALDLLAGQTGKTEESQKRVAEAAGTTSAALETQKVQTEAALKAQRELGQSLGEFIDPLGAYTSMLEEKREAEEKAARSAAETAGAGSDSWKQFVVDTGFSFDEYMARLEEQVTAQANWQGNMLLLAGRVSSGTLAELARMGPEGAPLVADLVNRSDAELDRFDDITAMRSQAATDAWGAQLTAAGPVLALIASTAGWGVADALAVQLQNGTTTVAKIASDYGIKIAEGVNPVLKSLGKTQIQTGDFQPRAGVNVRNADGNLFEDHQAEIAPGGAWRIWAEPETGGEAYIPLSPNKRGRSLNIWRETGKRLGVDVQQYAQGSIVDMGRRLQGMGARITGHGAFGGTEPGQHGASSLHYSNHAIDVNTRPGTSALEQQELAPMAALARSLGFRTIFLAPGHFNHLHVDDGGGGSMGSTGAMMAVELPKPPSTSPFASPISPAADAAMQHAYDQATAWLTENTIAPESSSGGTVGSGPAQEQVRAVASRYGWGAGAQWDALSRLIQGESGWNPNAANKSSSARGLFQKMTSLHGAIESSAAGQAEWGLNYIRSAYGSPSNAYAKWSSRSPHWYADGGIQGPVYHSGTDFVPETGWAYLERGEAVVPAAANPSSREFSGVSSGMGGGGSFSVPAPVVKVFLDGQEWRGMARVEAEGVVVNALTGSANRGRNNS